MGESHIRFYRKFNKRWEKLISHAKTLNDGGIKIK